MFRTLYQKVRNLPIIQKHLYLRQFIKFAITGGTSAIVDFGTYIFLTRIFSFFAAHYLWANFIGMAVAATGNFLVNRKWTFRNRGEKVFVQYIKFWLVVVVMMVAYQYLLHFFVETVNLYDILGKVIAALVIMLIRFNIHKFWVFR